jgi:hypothetical protein
MVQGESLTDEEYLVVKTLMRRCGKQRWTWFTVQELFPRRSRRNVERRHILSRLVSRGLIGDFGFWVVGKFFRAM